MPKLKLLVFDANIVIYLHEIGLWDVVVGQCEIYLSRVVIDDEVKYYDDGEVRISIDLSKDVEEKRLNVFDVKFSDIKHFRERFGPTYFERLDPGEAESLAFILQSEQEFCISTADSIVYKVLGNLNMGEQGISLEEILQRIGRGRSDLKWQYRKDFREKYTKDGQRDSLTGFGDKTPKW